MSHERLYEEHLALIEGVITLICRRHRLSAADADDFRQDAHVKLLEGGALAKYEGRSSLRTYLTIVLQRIYLDFRTRAWGKWRPSMEARRQGPEAVLLERLVVRDGLTFEEAFETMRTNHGVTTARGELEAVAGRLPIRLVRRAQGEEALAAVPASDPLPDARLAREELEARLTRTRLALDRALGELPPQERLIVRLRYEDGLSVAEIAKLQKTDAKPLYRRFEQLLARLRKRMAAEGVPDDPFGGDEGGE